MSKSPCGSLFSVGVGIEFIFLFHVFVTKFSTPILDIVSCFSNPVVITVIVISSPNDSSVTTPNMMLASGSTLLWISSAAVFASCNPNSLPPVILIITPLAPSIYVSSNGF